MQRPPDSAPTPTLVPARPRLRCSPSATVTYGTPNAFRALGAQMDEPRYTARIDNIYFLGRVAETLRWVTQDIAEADLPPHIKHLLAKLDRLEARGEAKRRRSADDSAPRR